MAFATTLAWLPVQSATIGDGWADVTPAALADLATVTQFGWVWMARCLIAGCLLALFLFRADAGGLISTLLSGLLLASLALIGHAAMSEGALGIAHRANDAMHVLATGFWIGALVPLMMIVALLDNEDHRGSASKALARFSSVAVAVVLVVIATGAANIWAIVGTWPTDMASPYQSLLAAKIVCVAAIIGLALLNRLRFSPRAAAGDQSGIAALRASIAAEIVLSGVVLILVAYFGTLDPA